MSDERIVTTPSNADPYAPPPIPTDNPVEVRKASPKKTLILWLVLIVMFVAIYQLIGGDHATSTAPHPRASQGWSLSWESFVIPGVFAAFFFWFLRRLTASKGYAAEYNAATLAIADGDLERALRGFQSLAEKNQGKQYGPTASINVAWMLQRLGRIDEERDMLLKVERSPGLFYASEHRTYAAIYLARHFALRGDLPRAESWLADAQRRRQRGRDLGLFIVAILRVTEAMVLARKEDDAAALALLEKDWSRIETGFTATMIKHVLVLRAYLLARTGGVRGDGVSSQWLAKARPLRLDEIAYLWKEWPALQQWAATQHLTAETLAQAS